MKIKKFAASLLLAACTFACACGDKSSGPKTGGVIIEPEPAVGRVEGTLHQVNVDFNSPVSDFVVNGQTDYKVVIGGDDRAKASGLLTEHIYKSAGAKLTVIELEEVTEVNDSTQYIFLGCEEFYQSLGGEMPDYDTLGVSGYQVVTVGKNVFINGYTIHGWQMGTLAFLREVIGYDMLAEDLVVYELDGKVMPEMDIIERPDFDYRIPNSTSVSQTEYFGMGYTYVDPCINTGESFVHNVYDFVSLEEMDENPDWGSSDADRWQLCYTSRGNKDSYQKMIRHIADKVIKHLKANPTKNTIMIGQHDIGGNTPMVQNCKCPTCLASNEYYGTFGAAWLSLCNRVSLLVDEYLQTQEAIDFFGGVKDWNLLQLVYHTQVNPPVKRDQNGYVWDENGHGIPLEEKWFDHEGNMHDWEEAWSGEDDDITESGVIKEWSESTDAIVAAPNVHYMYATSAADWTHSYLDIENLGWMNIAKGWAGVNNGNGGGEFFIWAYALNSEFLLYPYNSFDSSFETTRFFKNLGAKYIFWQGQYQNKNNAGFTKLRNYLDSKVEFDVNADYEFYVDKFFKYYYGVGGEYLQRFFDEVQAQCRYIEVHNKISGNIHNSRLGYAENWPEGLIKSWIDLLGEAFDAVEQEYRVTNPEKYEIYKNHITIEELFPVYVLCTTYADSYTASELKAMRKDFLNDFYALKNTSHAESRLMTQVTDAWDLD